MNARTLTCVVTILVALITSVAYGKDPATKTAKTAGSTLRIVKDDLYERGGWYFVKGGVYNPNTRAVKNVTIRYYIWKQFVGHDDIRRGSVVKETGGLVTAIIRYLPPKQTVEFTTDDSAPVYRDITPDLLEAQITADWDQ